MKKLNLLLVASALGVSGMMLSACGNKKADENKQDETQQMEELVEAVETPVPGINNTPYNAAFFNDESKKSDVATDTTYAVTDSGLKYVIAKKGTGKKPTATQTVTVHYVGTLTNGTQFDSSIDRGEPTSFPLNRVIPGWTEGLQLMEEGGESVFYIPSNLAYGEMGVPDPMTGGYSIPPSSPLLFWVQLIEVQ